jgi:hypothetical protein
MTNYADVQTTMRNVALHHEKCRFGAFSTNNQERQDFEFKNNKTKTPTRSLQDHSPHHSPFPLTPPLKVVATPLERPIPFRKL